MTSRESERRLRSAQAPPASWWVLVADDSKDVRDAFSEFLRTAGYHVRTADGPEALRMLEESPFPPALVVLDWLMPRVSGLEILHRVRTDPKLRHTRVVVMTGLGVRTAKDEELTARGVLRVLRKPISGKDLLAIVKDARTSGRPASESGEKE